MKEITVYVTYDGKRFDNFRAADIHLNSRYSILMKSLASSLMLEKNPIKFEQLLDAKIEVFRELIQVKDNMKLEDDNEY